MVNRDDVGGYVVVVFDKGSLRYHSVAHFLCEYITVEADEEDINERFTENTRHKVRNIPVVANLDLDKEDDSGELSDENGGDFS